MTLRRRRLWSAERFATRSRVRGHEARDVLAYPPAGWHSQSRDSVGSRWEGRGLMKLTDGQIAEYEERGFLGFPGLIDPAGIDLLRADLGRVMTLDTEEVTREKSGVVRTVFRVHDPHSPTASAPF